MSKNIFFKKSEPFLISEFFKANQFKNDIKIHDVKILSKATSQDISFFDSIKYSQFATSTKASCCITTQDLTKHLPEKCTPIIVKNVLFDLARITKKIYPSADIDYLDETLQKPEKSKYPRVKFGNNVLIGRNVEIGNNTTVGSNTIIEHNVCIGSNCVIGSQIVIRNSLIGNDVMIQDGCKIGLKGFGFIPFKGKNMRMPHIGKVILKNSVELGSNCTIDRGSIDDTIIGENTFLDNQVHMAHNVKIGDNCMIAGQVGFAGSSTIGNNVSIGGQAGISGHLKIGNNVKIGGGSGVVKNIEDNSIVMGYPAIPLKKFIKNSKKND